VRKMVKNIDPGIILAIVRQIYLLIRPWLKKKADETDTPVDNWMLDLLDTLLGVEG